MLYACLVPRAKAQLDSSSIDLHDELLARILTYIAVMHQIASAVQGTDARIMVDTNHAYGRADALRLGQALDQYDLAWYEEPVVPEDFASYASLRELLAMPIAGGENEHTLFGFRSLLGAGAVDIAQPDLGACGGIGAARHIIALGHAHGVMVNPHVWGSAVAQAASLQMLAAISQLPTIRCLHKAQCSSTTAHHIHLDANWCAIRLRS
jgi:L-alanine-DL-glutamate epimerase-like enolase superfamily enzyme